MRQTKIEWEKYKGLTLEQVPILIRRTVRTIVTRVCLPGLTDEIYLEKRASGYCLCSECYPDWKKKEEMSYKGHLCTAHYKLQTRVNSARRTARKLGVSELKAARNVTRDEGRCLTCDTPYKKKKGKEISFCKKCKLDRRFKTIFTNQLERDPTLPKNFVERRLKGERYCKKHKGFFTPKSRKSRCSICIKARRPLAKIHRWTLFAKNRGLNVAYHIEMMLRGYKVCKKCFHYNTTEAQKTKCANCGKNPRCEYRERTNQFIKRRV